MNKNTLYYLIAIGLFVLLKFWIGTFDNDQLQFLLKLTDKVFGLVTGIHSDYNSESGYFYDKFNILIDKSCSGYNFRITSYNVCYTKLLRYLTTKISEIIRYTNEIQNYSKPVILECFESFLIESQNEETRQYFDLSEQINEVLIHEHYLSKKDLEFCLDYDITRLSNQPKRNNFV